MRSATLTPAEREDREVERLHRPAPSKKPPRHDLRRDMVHDEDTRADRDPEDRDQSLNYKKIAAEFGRWAGKVQQDKRPKKPGDYWQTESAWGVFPKDADHPTSAPDEEAAKNLAEGQKDTPEAPPPKQKRQPPSPEERGKKLRRQIDKLLAGSASGDRVSKKALDAVLALEGKAFKIAARALVERIGERKASLAEGQGNWAAAAADGAEMALDEKDADKDSPEDKGRRAAELMFAERVLANPALVGGVPLSGDPADADKLKKRSEQSFRQFRDVTPKLREMALGNAATMLAEMAEDDPRRAELDGVVDGLALACYLEGEDPVARVEGKKKPGRDDDYGFGGGFGGNEVRLRPAMSDSFGKLARMLDDQGSATDLLMGATDFFGPRGRSAVANALDQASNEEIAKFLEDTPFEEVGEALKDESLGPAQLAVVRDAARRLTMEDMTTMQGVIAAFDEAPAKGAKKPREPGEDDRDAGREVRRAAAEDAEVGKALRAAADCLAEGGDRDACEEHVSRVVLAGLEAFDRAVEKVAKERGVKLDPQDPRVAKLRHAVETGNLDVLDQLVVKPESISHLSVSRDREDTTKMAPQPTPISRSAANGISSNLDRMANLVISEAEALGVPKKLAAQFAQVADQVADLVDAKAGIQRSAAQRSAADFNPEEIGEEVSGPLLDGTPEPYMKGEWSQQEFREIGDRQMSGDLAKDKPIKDPRAPTPGAQMRPLAKSLKASADKLSALAEMGQVSSDRMARAERALRLAMDVLDDNQRA